MKIFYKVYGLILIILSAVSFTFGQENYKPAMASRLLTFNQAGLENMGNEVLLPLSDSAGNSYNFSMKTMRLVDGIYYQVLSSRKNGNTMKIFLRKSSDGTNWGDLRRAGDAPEEISEIAGCIYVWKKNGTVNVGITYTDNREGGNQLRFALSTDGGQTFDSSTTLSTHSGCSYIYNGTLSGEGDTLAACWVPKIGNHSNKTWLNYSIDGGHTWHQMSEVYSQGQYSEVSDLTINNGGIWVIIGADQYYRKNLVVRYSSDMGASWTTMTQVMDMSSPHLNNFQHVHYFNGKLYVMWIHTYNHAPNWTDTVYFASSSDGGNSWSDKIGVSDADTLMMGSTNWPYYAHPSFDITPEGEIYAVWADSRERNDSRMDSSRFNIYLSRSTDDGLSWSPNIRINDSDLLFNRNYWADVKVSSQSGTDHVLVTWTKYRNTVLTGFSGQESDIPNGYHLSQNYPNPFNPSTKIKYTVPEKTHVKLVVYNLMGEEVTMLVNGEKPAGRYEVEFNGAGRASGLYIYRLEAGSYIKVNKALLIK